MTTTPTSRRRPDRIETALLSLAVVDVVLIVATIGAMLAGAGAAASTLGDAVRIVALLLIAATFARLLTTKPVRSNIATLPRSLRLVAGLLVLACVLAFVVALATGSLTANLAITLLGGLLLAGLFLLAIASRREESAR